MEFQTRYKTRKVRWSSSQPSLTEQADFQATLIPNILAGHGLVSNRQIQFGDFSKIPTDLGEAHAMIADAYEQFLTLPSDLRSRFDNDPMKLLAFLSNSANREEATKLGLLNAPAAAPAAAPATVSPAAPAAPVAPPATGSTSTPT